jgi:hypothetical protein
MNVQSNEVRLSDEERQAAFERARKILEKDQKVRRASEAKIDWITTRAISGVV